MSILAIDAGTTGVTALLISTDLRIVARGYSEFPQHFPADGWVEHDPGEIWSATLAALRELLATEQATADPPTAVGITNQRETICFWDRETLGSPRRAIVWQDRRTAGICAGMREAGHEPLIARLTGLRLDPYFSGTKLAWVRTEDPQTWRRVTSGEVAVGTVDSYLVARMTRGLHHVTDPSNASRTLLYDLHTGDWSPELLDLFGVPRHALPEIVSSYGVIGSTDPSCFLGLELPIASILGDQQAALFGQGCFTVGSSKCTYGTGSFVLVNTGEEIVTSHSGLLTTVAWQHPDGRREYALEGAVFVTGAAIQWLRDGLQIITSAAETEALARSVPDSGGVVFVPALTGLGAPDWDPVRSRHHHGHHPGHHAGAPRACDARGHRLRGARRRGPDDPGGRCQPARAGRRRRGCGQRIPVPGPGRPARRPGHALGRVAGHRPGRRSRRRPGDRGLGLPRGGGRRAQRSGRRPVRSPTPQPRSPSALADRGGAVQGVGPAALGTPRADVRPE